MTDNFYVEDLILSVRPETTLARFLPIADRRDELLSVMRDRNVTFCDDVTSDVLIKVADVCGADLSRLLTRFLHCYDFDEKKLEEIRNFEGTPEYDALAGLLRLPGVRRLRAQLYLHSGVTLETLAEKSTDEIRALVRAYVLRENRPETVPFEKEVNCHRAVAAMILHASKQNT